MIPKFFKKISWRLTLLYSLIFLLVIILVESAIFFSIKSYSLFMIKREFQHILGQIASEMLSEIQREGSFNIKNQDLVEDFNAFLLDYSIKITGPHGELVGISDKIKHIKLPGGVTEGRFLKFDYQGLDFLYYKKVIKHEGKLVAKLEIIRDISLLDEIQENAGVMIFFSMGLGAALSLLGGVFLTRQLLKPIGDLTTVANKITIGNLKERLTVGEVEDELTELAKTFNKMLERLEKAVDSQNQFVGDASHELRTPLAVIRGYINMLDRWGAEDERVLKEAIKAIKDETNNMSQLTEKLLQIAKGIGKQPGEFEKINWGLLIEEVFKETRLINEVHNIEIVSEPDIFATGDKSLLKQMVRIFLDNSIKYTPEQGEIRLQTRDLGTEIEFLIEDTGIGIPEAELDKVFNRFYRVDKARSRDQGGHGLGLYIAKQIIELHQGKVKIESKPGEGTTVRVNLPKEPAVVG